MLNEPAFASKLTCDLVPEHNGTSCEAPTADCARHRTEWLTCSRFRDPATCLPADHCAARKCGPGKGDCVRGRRLRAEFQFQFQFQLRALLNSLCPSISSENLILLGGL